MEQQKTSTDPLAANLRETVGTGARQVKESTQAVLEASRAMTDAYTQAVDVLRARVDQIFRASVALMEAGMNANCDHLNRLVEARSLQEVARLQMLWSANHTLTILQEFKKIGLTGDAESGKTKQG
ncbi:phasin family protein [Rhodopila sp.]|uniref:phasin family protein n=1 Tax=Rhodopila sp. TaxID=2480087 RepID=UPI002D7FC970|nr:phasin family protein [Rhodopila sp.]